MTAQTKTKAAKPEADVVDIVDLGKLQTDMEETVGSMSFPGTSRLLGHRKRIDAVRAELLSEREQFLSKQSLVDSQHAAISKAIQTNISDIDATLALYPETAGEASNITVLRPGAAE